MPETKQCTGPCQRVLPLGKFGKRRETANGLQYRCLDCRNKYKREDYSKKKVQILQYQKDRRKKISTSHGPNSRCPECGRINVSPPALGDRRDNPVTGIPEIYCRAGEDIKVRDQDIGIV